MPLGCDCYPGCWGDHSKDWPSFGLIDEGEEGRIIAAKIVRAAGVPRGSYVVAGRSLRVESSALLARIVAAAGTPAPLTLAALRAAQLSRSARWHGGKPWDGDRHLLAADGIYNEAADPARQLSTREGALAFIRKEAADAILYLDLACARYEEEMDARLSDLRPHDDARSRSRARLASRGCGLPSRRGRRGLRSGDAAGGARSRDRLARCRGARQLPRAARPRHRAARQIASEQEKP